MPRKKKDNPEMLPAINHKKREQNFEESTTFMSVMQLGIKNPKFILEKGQYNRAYIINLLRTLLDQIHSMRFSPKDLQLTLQHSIQKLLVDIEMEDFKTSGVKHDPETIK